MSWPSEAQSAKGRSFPVRYFSLLYIVPLDSPSALKGGAYGALAGRRMPFLACVDLHYCMAALFEVMFLSRSASECNGNQGQEGSD